MLEPAQSVLNGASCRARRLGRARNRRAAAPRADPEGIPVAIRPGPVEGVDPRTKPPVTRAPDPKAPLAALVFKTITDPMSASSRSSACTPAPSGRTASGNITRDARSASATRLAHGKTQKPVEALGPARSASWPSSRTRSRATRSRTRPSVILPASRSGARHLLRHPAEDPRRRGQDLDGAAPHGGRGSDAAPHFDSETKQLLVSGIGQLHVEVVVERMKRSTMGRVALPAHPLQGNGEGARGGAGKYKKRRAGAVSTATRGSRSSRSRGAAASSSWTTSRGPIPATSSPRWKRACATA